MPYCVMLEKGITYRPGGKLYPCCLWQWQDDVNKITDYQQFRKIIQEKRNKMNSSEEWIPECKQCKEDTKFKGDSFRDHANKTVKGGFWELNFNNTCNLSCRMCNGSLSSTWLSLIKKYSNESWHKDYTEIGYEDHLKFDKLEFYHELPNVRHIKILGGEPLLTKEVYRMLNYVIESGHSKHIVLEVTTNLTQPWTDWWMDLIDKFEQVNICGSVDGLRERYEYIRPGGDWQQVSDMAKNLLDITAVKSNFRMRVSACGMTLTAHQHNEMNHYWKEQVGMKVFDIEQVYEPTFMSYRSLRPELREQYGINPGFDYDHNEWNELVKQMKIQDKIHHTDFEKTFPELFGF
jgi:organic radical activating enzyme